MQLTDAQIKRFVLDTALVTRKDVDTAAALASERGISFADALRSQGSLTQDDIRRASAYVLGVPYVSLVKRAIDSQVMLLMPEAIARTYSAIPYAMTDDTVEVALLDLAHIPALEGRMRTGGRRIVARLTDTASIQSALSRYQRHLHTAYSETIRRAADTLKHGGAPEEVERHARTLLDTLMHHALTQGARVIHIEPGETCMIRYRIGTTLHDAMELPKHVQLPLEDTVASLARLPSLGAVARDGRFRITRNGERVAVRVRTMHTHAGTAIALTLVRAGGHGFTLDGLGFHGALLEEFLRASADPRASILLSGPLGSGKTTTLYTLLDTLRTPATNVITVESSIGAPLTRVHQVSIRPDIGFDTQAAVRAALAQDPDIIGIDTESDPTELTHLLATARLRAIRTITSASLGAACEALEVFAKATGDATLPFTHVLGAATVRMLGGNREAYHLSARDMDNLRDVARMHDILEVLKEERVIPQKATWSSVSFYRAPLETPEHEVYTGMIGVHELLTVTPELLTISKKPDASNYLAHAVEHGMFTLVEDAIMKAVMGITTLDEVWRIVALYYGENALPH
ncbi:hypothetical protein A3C89_03515 [Candidatus Kaiserbacteria bacterium RIFCSPHIGHO2_02_FULL_50_50]|uniref:Bacterial type II secretion system protein E domain-containing protein n=1 Tax=Candidatus Kaiserbacteria bacterium RIFCSPHIGHO2_02_FULL_50_50 TaxID=1798492 RepID=A0A1F6DBV2_9BACT|nr:MAG: hypothetical protein A3C89_03515 [Candidatus Kaiserbacteria bacterium RIFCSPHIGHO2_02_FULL_50_50]OGG88529.1 MAG: hypothetical protein A3G62_03405 [Candidatus Kaiserbacteria bacterium RIFCSPLOWO2_12_FULL_50_10]